MILCLTPINDRARGPHGNGGDVVLVPFPFQDMPGEKIRPAVVVQNDTDNARLINTVIVMITGNLRDAGEPITILVDPSTPEGAGSGLTGVSLIKCYNLATVRQSRVIKVIGHLWDALLKLVGDGIRVALELP